MKIREHWEVSFTVQRPHDPYPLIFNMEGDSLEEVVKRLWARAGKNAEATVNSMRCRSLIDYTREEAAAKVVDLLRPSVEAEKEKECAPPELTN